MQISKRFTALFLAATMVITGVPELPLALSVQAEEVYQEATPETAQMQNTTVFEKALAAAQNENTPPAAKPLPSDLDGNEANNVVKIARSQLGYEEGNNNYTIYAADLGVTNNLAWCATFASWCMKNAGVSEDRRPSKSVLASSTGILTWYRDRGRWHRKNGHEWSYGQKSDDSPVDYDYEPKPGDLILLETQGGYGDGPDHIGIVVAYNNGTVYTVEGNTSEDAVSSREYSASSPKIWGYCNPEYYGSGSVTPDPTPSGAWISLSNETVPHAVLQGNTFSIGGTITSSSNLEYVGICILDYQGNEVVTAKSSPNTTSYNLKELDNSVPFGSLSSGCYTYQIEATNVQNHHFEQLYNAYFYVYNQGDADFYANIINSKAWKHTENNNNNFQIAVEGNTNSLRQVWHFVQNGDGSYNIYNCYDGRALGVDSDNIVTLDSPNVGWYMLWDGNGQMFMANNGNKVMDMTNNDSAPGTNVALWSLCQRSKSRLQCQ